MRLNNNFRNSVFEPLTRFGIVRLMAVLMVSVAAISAVKAQTSVTAIALFKDRVMLSVDGSKAEIVHAGSTHAGVKVLSSDTEQAIVEINGQREILTLNSAVSVSSELGVAANEEGGSINLIKKRDGHFHTIGQVNGRTVNFLIDTGASIVVMSSDDAKRIGLEYKHGFVATASTASGDSPMYTIRADQIKIGNIQLEEVSLGVIEGRFPVTPLLGMSFLGQLDMTQTGRSLRIEQR